MYQQPLTRLIEDRTIAMPASSGETLFMQGEPCESAFEIRRGVVRAVNHSREGCRQVMAFFFAGDTFGLPLASEHRYSAEAVGPVLFLRQPPHARSAGFREPVDADEGFLAAVWREEKAFMTRGLILGRVGALARMAAFISSVSRRLPRCDEHFEFPLPQTDIASYLATSPETVCRSLRQLRELKIIAMPSKERLAILAPEKLALLAEGV